MRETVREWQEEWIGTNGLTHELEVIISDSSLEAFRTEVYSGSFADIPPELFEKQVIENGKINASTGPERIGAYSLLV